jgi:NDP-sugar pyrophosphorylase family protein
MEAIVLAGGKAERLGDAAGGLPKALVPVAGRPLAAYQLDLLAAAGVVRVVVSCSAGQGQLFEEALTGLGLDVVQVEEPEPLGRGGGLRLASGALEDKGPCFALNGDELLDVDLRVLAARHDEAGLAATIVVTRPRSPFGVVDIGTDDRIIGFREAGLVDHWVSCGVYVLGPDARERLPERGDHETTTFPTLAEEGLLAAFRHDGLWLTVNTPKDLRTADEYLRGHRDTLRGDA